jgi:hypothetical protein
VNFETYEVDLQNKSEEFLAANPTGKVPVVVADGDSLYESNVVDQYLDEVFESPRLLPEDPRKSAYARIWIASVDDGFFPAVFVAGVGRERGFSEDRISEALEKLKAALGALEERPESRVPRRRVLPRRPSPRRQLRPPARARREVRHRACGLPERRRLDAEYRSAGGLQSRGMSAAGYQLRSLNAARTIASVRWSLGPSGEA